MEGSTRGRDKGSSKKGLASSPKIDKLKLSDGNEYNLAPLDLNRLVEFEDTFGQSAGELINSGRLKYIRFLIYLRLRPNYPDMTEEQAGALVDMDVIEAVRKMLGA